MSVPITNNNNGTSTLYDQSFPKLTTTTKGQKTYKKKPSLEVQQKKEELTEKVDGLKNHIEIQSNQNILGSPSVGIICIKEDQIKEEKEAENVFKYNPEKENFSAQDFSNALRYYGNTIKEHKKLQENIITFRTDCQSAQSTARSANVDKKIIEETYNQLVQKQEEFKKEIEKIEPTIKKVIADFEKMSKKGEQELSRTKKEHDLILPKANASLKKICDEGSKSFFYPEITSETIQELQEKTEVIHDLMRKSLASYEKQLGLLKTTLDDIKVRHKELHRKFDTDIPSHLSAVKNHLSGYYISSFIGI